MAIRAPDGANKRYGWSDGEKPIRTLEIFFLCKMTNYQGQRKNDELLQSMHLLIETLSADHCWNGKLVRGKTKLFFNTQAPHFERNKGFCESFGNDLLYNFYLLCARKSKLAYQVGLVGHSWTFLESFWWGLF